VNDHYDRETVNAAWDKLAQPTNERLSETRDKQQQSYEQTIVMKLVRATGETASPRQLKDVAMALFQMETLNLHWFQQAYPRFPLQLQIGKVDWAHKAMLDLFLSFEKSTIYKALQTFAESAGLEEGRDCFGIVFSVVKHGDMVLHTYQGDRFTDAKEQPKKRDRASFRYNSDVAGQDYILETLPRLLTKIGDSWFD
jgi:hypothetical protein